MGNNASTKAIRKDVIKKLNTQDKAVIYNGAIKLACAWLGKASSALVAFTKIGLLNAGDEYPNAGLRTLFINTAYRFANDLDLLSNKTDSKNLEDSDAPLDNEDTAEGGTTQNNQQGSGNAGGE